MFSGLILSLSFVIGHWSFAAPPELTLIEAQRDRGFDYLDIYTSGHAEAEGLLLENKLILDFPGIKLAKDIKVIKPKKSKRIKDIRVKEVKGQAQVVIDLKQEVDYDIVNVFGRNKSVIEISDRLDHADKLMTDWEETDLKKKAPTLEPKKYRPAAKKKEQYKKLPLEDKVIVIDPGHGGLDLGAVGVNNISEKRLTLATAKKLAYLLNAAGATVYLTRNTDRTVGIRDIISFANKTKPDIFISIHYNYSTYKKASGVETYYYNRNGRKLALALHRSLVRGIKRRDRGLRRARYYTLRNIKYPAVIVEPLYLSHDTEVSLAASAAYQAKIAQYIVAGVKSYFRN